MPVAVIVSDADGKGRRELGLEGQRADLPASLAVQEQGGLEVRRFEETGAVASIAQQLVDAGLGEGLVGGELFGEKRDGPREGIEHSVARYPEIQGRLEVGGDEIDRAIAVQVTKVKPLRMFAATLVRGCSGPNCWRRYPALRRRRSRRPRRRSTIR